MHPFILIAALATSTVCEVTDNHFGICSHMTRHSFKDRDRILNMMSLARINDMRCDVDWTRHRHADGTWDFTILDELLVSTRRAGVTMLPILGAIPKDMVPLKDHLDGFREYVAETMKHLGNDCPAIEVFNEENIWQGSDQSNPTNYLNTLKVAYETIKATHPKTLVCVGGLSGIGYNFMREIYRLGGAKFFDIVCVHTYTIPYAPEGRLERELDRLRELMRQNGDDAKPIWISEAGFPTHRNGIGTSETQILLTGLRAANPNRKSWRVAFAALVPDNAPAPQSFAEELLGVLPLGSTAKCYNPKELADILSSDGTVDAVVLPTDSEGYMGSSIDAITAWVRRGGTLIELGGAPLYGAYRFDAGGNVTDDHSRNTELDRANLGIGFAAWWTDKELPKRGETFATKEALALGLKAHPAGYSGDLFINGRYLKDGESMMPLLAGKSPSGKDLVSAAIYKIGPGGRGTVVVSCLRAGWGPIAHTEEQQALYLTRYAAISAAYGIEKFYAYEMMAMENDPYYSENHFGIVHANGVPKPAYCAYATLTERRPAGSKALAAPWRDLKCRDYWPQWTRPDKVKAGMIWTTETPRTVDLEFDSDWVTFIGTFGLPPTVRKVAKNVYRVKISQSPVYFSHAHLKIKGKELPQ